MSFLAEVRRDVVATCRRAAEERLVVGTAGNVSCRVGDDLVAITATGAVFAELGPAEVAVVDLRGGSVDGDL